MKALLIGGTGVISADISRLLVEEGWDVTLLNRGSRPEEAPGAKRLTLDIADEPAVAAALSGQRFDVVADFIAYVPAHVERDIRLFSGKTAQYIFISSASAYQKPLSSPVITEATPLRNPYWAYSRNKIACEDALTSAYRETGFPVTIVRPSHTFSRRSLPLPIHGDKGVWQVLRRMQEGKRVLVPGDGTSLWSVMSSRDFAPAFVGLMGNVHAIGQAVQIAGQELLTWNQIMASIAAALGVAYRPCYVPSDLLAKCPAYDFAGGLLGDKAHSVIFDSALLRRLVPSFQPRLRFDQAVRDSVQYFLSHPEAQTEDPAFDQFCDRVIAIMDRAGREIAGC